MLTLDSLIHSVIEKFLTCPSGPLALKLSRAVTIFEWVYRPTHWLISSFSAMRLQAKSYLKCSWFTTNDISVTIRLTWIKSYSIKSYIEGVLTVAMPSRTRWFKSKSGSMSILAANSFLVMWSTGPVLLPPFLRGLPSPPDPTKLEYILFILEI